MNVGSFIWLDKPRSTEVTHKDWPRGERASFTGCGEGTQSAERHYYPAGA